MLNPPHISAEIEYLTVEAGGRKTPAVSGYRPQFYYRGNYWDAQHDYPNVGEVQPGNIVYTLLRFTLPSAHFGNISVGSPFLIREGLQIVAFGVVREVFAQLQIDASGSD